MIAVALTCLERCGAWREGAANDRLAVLAQHLHVDVRAMPVLLQQALGRNCTLLLVDPGPGLREAADSGVAAENPGVLVQRMPEQQCQAGDQCNGEPEGCENAPEQ